MIHLRSFVSAAVFGNALYGQHPLCHVTRQPNPGLGFPKSFLVERYLFPNCASQTWASERPGGGLSNPKLLVTPRISDSVGFGCDPKFAFLKSSQVLLLVPDYTFKNHCCEKNITGSIKDRKGGGGGGGCLLHGHICITHDPSHTKAGDFVCVDPAASPALRTGAGIH